MGQAATRHLLQPTGRPSHSKDWDRQQLDTSHTLADDFLTPELDLAAPCELLVDMPSGPLLLPTQAVQSSTRGHIKGSFVGIKCSVRR